MSHTRCRPLMVATFTVGLLLVAEGNWRDRLLSVAKQPVIYSMAIAVVLLVTHTDLPRWLSNTVDLLGGIAIPLMTIALGVSLATLTQPPATHCDASGIKTEGQHVYYRSGNRLRCSW